MDPFSLTTGAIGLASAAITALNGVRDFADHVREAPEIRATTLAELASLNDSLSNLQELLDTALVPADVSLTASITACRSNCETLAACLETCTSRSTDEKLSKVDSLALYFRRSKLDRFRARLAHSMAILGLALNVQQVAQQAVLVQQGALNQQIFVRDAAAVRTEIRSMREGWTHITELLVEQQRFGPAGTPSSPEGGPQPASLPSPRPLFGASPLSVDDKPPIEPFQEMRKTSALRQALSRARSRQGSSMRARYSQSEGPRYSIAGPAPINYIPPLPSPDAELRALEEELERKRRAAPSFTSDLALPGASMPAAMTDDAAIDLAALQKSVFCAMDAEMKLDHFLLELAIVLPDEKGKQRAM